MIQDDTNSHDPRHYSKRNRKAAFRAAFLWTPVAFAVLFCMFCISFLVYFHPALATSEGMQDPSADLSFQTQFASSSYSSERQLSFLSHVFTKEVLFWEDEILDWASIYQLDPNLVAVVMQIESCGHPQIESGSGAKGLFQVMPFHFTEDEDPFDPDTNAYRGLSYLSKSLSLASNDIALALAGYNGGHGVIALQPSTWFNETKRYVYWGSGILSDIEAGEIQSSRLKEWLMEGGESLCNRSADELGL
jgi:soluble lytic murein transglycosylase-like protein